MNLNEHINISDNAVVQKRPTGIISIYNSKGELVSQTHNTIVKTGRKIIANAFSLTLPVSDAAAAASYGVKLGFGYTSNPSVVTANASLSDCPTDAVAFDLSTSSFNYVADDLQFTISYEIKLSNINSVLGKGTSLTSYCINTIFTKFTNSSDNTSVLFSKAYIDPIFIDANTVYTISYSFYF